MGVLRRSISTFGVSITNGLAVTAQFVNLAGLPAPPAGVFPIHSPLFTISSPPPTPLAFSSPVLLPNGRFTVTLSGATGQAYRVQASTNLTSWIDLAVGAFTGVSAQFGDSNANNFPHRFYRIVSP